MYLANQKLDAVVVENGSVVHSIDYYAAKTTDYMKILIAIGIVLFLNILELVAQSDFRNGFIVKNNNDTIYGLIDYKGNKANAKKCIFRIDINSSNQIFTPDDIKAYRFINSKYSLVGIKN